MDDNPVYYSDSHGLESASDKSQVEGEVATKRNTTIIDNAFTDKEVIPVKSSLEKYSTTFSAAKRKQPLEVTDSSENGKRSRLSLVGFARTKNYGPMPTDLAPILALNGGYKASSCLTPVLSQDMFDDAEGDETFDIEVYKQPANPIYIRSDLVAAILGSPPKPRASGTGTPPVIAHPYILVKIDKPRQDNKGQKRMANRKAKKKIVTEKERIALITMLKDKVDLLRILPKDDCNVLGKDCSIFTLQQLGWVLDDGTNLPDVSSRQKAREMMTQKLKEHLITIKKIEVIKEEDTFQVAEKIKVWKSLIENWKEDIAKVSDVEQFPLDGPLSCFFPTGTLQFIKSVGVKTVFDFLYLKKTESGLVIEMFRAWRKICGLKDMTLHSLAKHLTGINARIEISFKCEQIAENDSMEWMTGAMIVLSGAAKVFAVDYSKIISATQFVNSKTKTLADNLAYWRAKHGLTELKGSGTVAMISSWKAQVKDELEIEISEGEVIPEQEIRKEIESIMPPAENESVRGDEQEKRRKTKTTKSKTNSQSYDIIKNKGKTDTIVKIHDVKRISKDAERGGSISRKSVRVPKSNSINPFDALSKSNKVFLATMNISTASQFLATRTTDIANKFIKYREDKGMSSLKGLGAVASISGWKKLVRNKAVLNGDLTLAQLNQARNTKIMTAETAVKSADKKVGKTIDSRLGELDALVTRATSKESKNKHKFSVLSTKQNVVFYFEFEVREYQSREYRRYLRYLGNDPVSMAVDPTVEINGNAKNVCVPIIVDLDDKSDMMSGRQPYDSLTYGTIELDSLVQSSKEDDAYGTALEEVIKAFVLQKKESCRRANDLMPSGESFPSTGIAKSYIAYPPPANTIRSEQARKAGDKSRSTFNMFKLLRNGKQGYMLCQAEPIEKGQSVELCLLPFDIFNKSWLSEENDSKVRTWIQDQLVKLPAQVLLKLFEFLEGDVAKLVCFDFAFKGGELSSNDDEDTSSYSSMTTVELTIARRRIHWVTVKIHENLQIISEEFTRNFSTNLLWTKAFVRKLLDHSYWSLAVSESIEKEISQEIHDEFSYRGFNGFASTFNLWCPIAKRLFDFTVDLFVGFSGGLESFSSETNLITELCSMVTRSISDLKVLSCDLQKHKIRDLLLKFALDYKKGVRHHSNFFPSFEEVTQKCVIEPYEHAMSLCNEPVCKLNSTKDLQIVVLEQVCGSSGKKVSRFQDLEDTKEVCEGANIDVRWYVDRQILAVIQTLIRCGMATFILENEKECLNSIEAKLLETAHLAFGETKIQIPSLENSEIHRPIHVAQSMSNDLSEQTDRSSPAPSASPIFLGFIWPLLKAEGWKLAAGDLPSDILYIPPVETKNQVKNLFLKERSKLFRDASSFGLGYIPKLTKRLFIRCLEEEVAFEKNKDSNGKSEEASTKAVMEAFASSLISKLKQPGDRSTDGIELQKIQGIVSEVLSLFNELVPLIFSNEDKCKLTEGKQWSDILGCRYLLKVLMIVPNVLKDANLPIQQNQHTISVIHELLHFLSENQHDLFGDCFHLPNEEYFTESKFPSSLPSQIKKAIIGDSRLKVNKSSQSPADEDVSIELIHPGDRVNLTDFVTSVMSQAIIGNANVDDINRQERFVAGCHPYLVCRHCLGTNGGKYSYGSYESIGSAASTIEKHILRCSSIDNEVKQEIITTRAYHSEQIKGLPSGAQSDFFKRLYNRLQQSMILPSNESLSDRLAVSDTINNTRAFRSHICVMKYLQSTEPWKSSKPLSEMVDIYYSSLEYGGKMYDTNESNHTFSSEWIYSKLAPK